MKTIEKYHQFVEIISKAKWLPLLLLRLILAYGFFGPAKMKWSNMDGIINWFSQMGMPMPALNAYLAASTEAFGVILLFLGLGTRIITIPLMFVMFVAIKTVHWQHGFAAGDNGFEIPLYYMLMLLTLFIMGPGKISLDHLINHFQRKR
jgi:putative oxidoreductase